MKKVILIILLLFSFKVYALYNNTNEDNKLNIISISTNSIKLSYESNNSFSYEIYRSTDKKKWNKIKVKNNVVNDKKLKANKTYYYKLREYYKINKKKIYLDNDYIIEVKTLNNSPKIDTYNNNYKSIKLVINNTSNNYYEIYRSTNKKKNYEKIDTINNNEYIDDNLVTNKTYYYKIKMCEDSNKCTNYSNIKSIKPKLGKPTNITSSLKVNNITLKWNNVSDSDGYEVYKSTKKKKGYKMVYDTNNLEFNSTIKPSKTNYYKVRAYKIINDKKVYGSYSKIIKVKGRKLSKKEKEALNKANKLVNKYKYSKEVLLSKLDYNNKIKNLVIDSINFENILNDNIKAYLSIDNYSNETIIDLLVNYDKFDKEEVLKIINNYSYGEIIETSNSKLKKDLYLLGYQKEEIDNIINSFNINDINNYLLEDKYNNLFKFKESEYFNINNIDRYQSYYDKNNYNEKDVVTYVEIGLDYEFYTNKKPSNVSDGKLILVNKYYYINKDYDADLEKLGKGYGVGSLNKEAAKYFREMVNAAKEDGITLKSVSAYRSYDTQKNLYNSYVKRDGKEKADTYSARPGHSEHNTGLAVDINTASSSVHFENSKEYEWLINNSYKYGYILRYPKGKKFITGYKFEPWHYRYIGVETATEVYNMNVTYEEYIILKRK